MLTVNSVLNLSIFIIFSSQKSMVGFPGQDGDIRVSWTHVLSHDSSYRQPDMAIFFWKKPKNCLSHSQHICRGEKLCGKHVEDARPPSSHQILHTREGMWNPRTFLKGLELHIRYLQILRTVPEAWAPKHLALKTKESLRSRGPKQVIKTWEATLERA